MHGNTHRKNYSSTKSTKNGDNQKNQKNRNNHENHENRHKTHSENNKISYELPRTAKTISGRRELAKITSELIIHVLLDDFIKELVIYRISRQMIRPKNQQNYKIRNHILSEVLAASADLKTLSKITLSTVSLSKIGMKEDEIGHRRRESRFFKVESSSSESSNGGEDSSSEDIGSDSSGEKSDEKSDENSGEKSGEKSGLSSESSKVSRKSRVSRKSMMKAKGRQSVKTVKIESSIETESEIENDGRISDKSESDEKNDSQTELNSEKNLEQIQDPKSEENSEKSLEKSENNNSDIIDDFTEPKLDSGSRSSDSDNSDLMVSDSDTSNTTNSTQKSIKKETSENPMTLLVPKTVNVRSKTPEIMDDREFLVNINLESVPFQLPIEYSKVNYTEPLPEPEHVKHYHQQESNLRKQCIISSAIETQGTLHQLHEFNTPDIEKSREINEVLVNPVFDVVLLVSKSDGAMWLYGWSEDQDTGKSHSWPIGNIITKSEVSCSSWSRCGRLLYTLLDDKKVEDDNTLKIFNFDIRLTNSTSSSQQSSFTEYKFFKPERSTKPEKSTKSQTNQDLHLPVNTNAPLSIKTLLDVKLHESDVQFSISNTKYRHTNEINKIFATKELDAFGLAPTLLLIYSNGMILKIRNTLTIYPNVMNYISETHLGAHSKKLLVKHDFLVGHVNKEVIFMSDFLNDEGQWHSVEKRLKIVSFLKNKV